MIDKFRSEARKCAWYTRAGDTSPNYNPFCRTRFQERHRARELGNINNHSETCVTEPTGSAESSREGEEVPQGLNHARTMPLSSGANQTASLNDDIEMTSPPTSDTNRPLAGAKRHPRRRLFSRMGLKDPDIEIGRAHV